MTTPVTGEIEARLREIISAMQRIAIDRASRDGVRAQTIEECAKIAASHDHEAGIKKLGKANWKYTSDEARAEISAESRGEKIASEIIAEAIRALSAVSIPRGEV